MVISKLQTSFTKLLPEIQSRARVLLMDHNVDAKEEAVQDITSAAWKNFTSCCRRKRVAKVTPSGLARFAYRNYRAGRRFCGTSVRDAMAAGTRVTGRVHLSSYETAGPDDESLWESLADRRVDMNPFEHCRRRMDWREIMLRCTERQARVLKLVAEGWRTSEISRAIGVTAPRISQVKTEIAEVIEAFGYGPAA